MAHNPFGRVSRLSLKAVCNGEGKTILQDLSFTAPYKVMHPFEKEDGLIQVMLLAASAGIMDGDRQYFAFDVTDGAKLEFTSQAYEKIHQMVEGCAKRHADIHVGSGAFFCYNPQPTIPFADSAFENSMTIHLDDETAGFQMSEIFTCGRYIRGEKFAYKRYYNLVDIYRGDKLVYRDNTRYDPCVFQMDGMGMFEDYTHLANIFVSRPVDAASFKEQTYRLLQDYEETPRHDTKIEGCLTELSDGDYAVRIFGMRAQVLEEVKEKIMTLAL